MNLWTRHFSITIELFLFIVMKMSVVDIHQLQIKQVTCIILFNAKDQMHMLTFIPLPLFGGHLVTWKGG